MKRTTIALGLSALSLPAMAASPYPADPQEWVQYKNISATPTSFTLRGGQYAIEIHAGTWGGGSVILQRQAADGSTFVNVVNSCTADCYATVNLPTGTFQLSVTTASGVYAEVVSIILGAAQ